MTFIEADEATFAKWHKYTNQNGRFEFRELPDGRKVIHEEILNSPDFPEILLDLEKLPKTIYSDENETI